MFEDIIESWLKAVETVPILIKKLRKEISLR